jgi:hypothetical protein
MGNPEIDMVYRIETDAQRPGRAGKAPGEFRYLSDEELKREVIPRHKKRLSDLQKARVEITKLPEFPDADLIRTLTSRTV